MKPVRITDYKEMEIPIEEEFINVELEAFLSLENDGIGCYEFWGQKGYDRGVDYFVLEDIQWKESAFDEPTNAIIRKWVEGNWDSLANLFEDGDAVNGYFDSLNDEYYKDEE